ncbi:adenylate kinase [Clonorchis sinensis]|uniref:Adenylate kinase n=1 Tax=Clonorchis sinensis TaxID=79923 RepID=G7YLH1_CLOSI|nr:adenylate kinase [Clonorchis sinensis]
MIVTMLQKLVLCVITGLILLKHFSQSPVLSAEKDEDNETLEEETVMKEANKGGEHYEVYGTLSSPSAEKPGFVKEIFKVTFSVNLTLTRQVYLTLDLPVIILTQSERRKDLYDRVITCDFIVYNIKDDESLIDEAMWMLEKLHENMEQYQQQKIFVLLSTVLTWARSAPLDEDAWNNKQVLSVPGDGENIVPTIHVKDLAHILQMVVEVRPKKHYIIAKDGSQNTLQQIVKQNHLDHLLVNIRMEAGLVSELARFRWHCENGIVENIKQIVREFKLARKLVPIRLCILGPPASGKTTLAKRLCEYYKLHHVHIKDVVESSIAALKRRSELAAIAAAAAASQVSKPRGPKLAMPEGAEEEGYELADTELLDAVLQNMEENNGRLTNDYISDFFRRKLHSEPCENQGYIIDGYPKSRKQAEALFSGATSFTDEDEEAEEGNEVEEGEELKLKDDSTLTPTELFAKEYLNTGLNVVDVHGEPIRLPTQPIPNQLPKGLLPAYVFELQASDKFLRDRIMNMPESKVQGTHYTEAGLLRRLNEYRVNQLGLSPLNPGSWIAPDPDAEENGTHKVPLNKLALASINENSIRAYFDSKGVPQIPVDVMGDENENLESTFRKIVHFIGPPRNYGLTPEEQLEQEQKAIMERMERDRIEEQRVQMEIADEESKRQKFQEEWKAKQEAMEKQETALLDKESEPLRAYLRKHVMPVLAQGLTECVRRRPEDPIDFLAEYLFFHNPQVD